MHKSQPYKGKIFLLFIIVVIFIFIFISFVRSPGTNWSIPKPRGAQKTCPYQVSEQTITPLINTDHFLVSAYTDQRVNGFSIRIIGIFKRDAIQTLHCVFCCEGHLSTTTPTTILPHSDHFGFPFDTTDVMCQVPSNCDATHVTLLTQPDGVKALNHSWLPIRNKNMKVENKIHFNFTVCISTLFDKYNNVLQFAQTLEIYRLLGVNRVVVYNTSSGPDLDRLLRSYNHGGFLEVVPWPIDQYLRPSSGWLFSQYGGDLHYFGQLTTLNECIYRSMDRSRYVLLNDIDEIIMPYQHNNLMSLMDMLQQQHPNAGVFLIESHVFPKKPFEQSKKSPLPYWKGVPGYNILERIYREEPDRKLFHPYKMIVQPRFVEQTSVHDVLKMSGEKVKVPPEVCHIIHCPTRAPIQGELEQLYVDTRLWDFKDNLIPRVNEMLTRGGLLNSTGKS
ncbi:Beta-1,4-galactosyltransferase galt-1 [Channa argus]|uniref:Glycosyltransferase family 92 protein n=1 Tax=Channa argus TaxID=215402 RepID=A0A6G1QFC4_CHAAH|nr:Beta-1,4-galactosyltransferase galt-1 [Channa argus]